ncbi:MAG: alkaline phosphatase family protein [Thermodesulfobacteriota bacterium]
MTPCSYPKTVILGLDGVGWSLIQRLIGEGIMPALAALMSESVRGPMNSTWPDVSPVAWTTFFTGRPAAHHGIYGFTEFNPGGYEVRLNSSAEVKTPWLWDWLDLRGRRSVVLNVPLTYPARPLAGVMVSGFVALDYDRAVHPAWVADFLRSIGYRLEADFERVHTDRTAFLSDLDLALSGREKLMARFWPDDWDLFALVITDTDRLLHFFYREYLEKGPITGYFLDFFRRIDALVGRTVELALRMAEKDRDLTLVMLSDHGFAPVETEFHLNRWLRAKGYQKEPLNEARVLALDPGRIYINRPPRFPGGGVGGSEAERLKLELSAALAAEPAVFEVKDGDRLYSGPWAHLAPDLVLRPRPGYELKAKFTAGPVYTSSLLMGGHCFDDAFYLIREFKAPSPLPEIEDILDLGRRLLARYGLQ